MTTTTQPKGPERLLGVVSRMRRRTSDLVAVLLVLSGVLARLRAVPPALGDVDSVNFARSLVSFDPLHQAPHWPGYPVYVLVSKIACLGTSERAQILALTLPGILLFAPAAALLYAGLRRRFGSWAALGALTLAAIAPGSVLAAAWPGSDGLGFAMLVASAGILAGWPERARIAGLILGLMMGVRLSWWPLALAPIFFSSKERRAYVTAFALGVAAHVLPLIAIAAPGLVEIAARSAARHAHAIDGAARLSRLADNFIHVQLGGAAVALAIAALSIAGARRRIPGILAIGAPYLVWVVLAQNLEKARHLVPLLPIAGAIAGLGVRRLGALRAPIAAAVALGLAFAVVPRAVEQGTRPSPAAALSDHLLAGSPDRLQVFAGESARVIEHRAPMIRVWRPENGDVLRREVDAALLRGARVMIASDAPGAADLGVPSVRRFTASRTVRPESPVLELVEELLHAAR
jgi:hypothetical protein